MIRILRWGCLLATLQVALGVVVFLVENAAMAVSAYEIARTIIIASVSYFAFTLLELSASQTLSTRNSSYYIGANLGFSLLRMMLTIAALFICKKQEDLDFTLVFINMAVYYMLTLAFSAWHRSKLSTKKDSSHDTSH